MQFTLIRDGDSKILRCGTRIVASWDKHDSYESCVRAVEARMGPDDTFVEKTKGEKEKPVAVDSGLEGDDV